MEKIEQSYYYHIYNRGIDSMTLFRNDWNKEHFIRLMKRHLYEKVSILCYCLMKNHFHFVVQIIVEDKKASQAFSNMFNAYTKAFNKKYNRTGSLFEKNFRRKKVEDEDYLRNLIVYIHTNPVHHGIQNDYKTYRFSSYQGIIDKSKAEVILDREYVVGLFDSKENLEWAHDRKKDNIINGVDI